MFRAVINGLRALAENFKDQSAGIKHLSFSGCKQAFEHTPDFSDKY